MKRFIAATDAEGRSYLESTEELDDSLGKIHIWKGSLALLDQSAAGVVIDPDNVDLQPGVHGVNWMLNHIPPDRDRAKLAGYQQRPMHRTRTVDFDYILDGELHCQLDLDRVELQAGDVLILRGENHVWFNPGDRTATMLNFLYEPR